MALRVQIPEETSSSLSDYFWGTEMPAPETKPQGVGLEKPQSVLSTEAYPVPFTHLSRGDSPLLPLSADRPLTLLPSPALAIVLSLISVFIAGLRTTPQ